MTRRILRELKLDKIAAVDRPCQEGARAVIMKRQADADAIWKAKYDAEARRTMAANGEAMSDGSYPIKDGADLENAIHEVGRGKNNSHDAIRAHIISRAKSLGLTDKLPQDWSVSKSTTDNNGDPDMSAIAKALGLPDTATEAEITAAITKAAGAQTALEKTVNLLKAKADLSDKEREHMKTLSDDDADDFAMKSKTDRAKAMEKAATGDETFVSSEGVTISKRSVGDSVYAVLKSQDERIKKQAADLAIEKAERENAVFAKRAGEEMSHLSGKPEQKAAFLKALSAMPDDVRTYATDLVKGADAQAKLAFEKRGVGGGYDENSDDPASKLDSLAKAHAKDKNVDYATAYDAVCKTEDGQRLYKAYRDGKPAVAA